MTIASGSDLTDKQHYTDAIRARAAALGLELAGIASAEPPQHAAFFRQWLKDGMAGRMTYLNRSAKRRCEPQRVMKGVRSMITVGQSYFTGRLPQAVQSDRSRGVIASYAWGRDYHDVLLDRLEELAAWMEAEIPGCETRCYVDTGPVLERSYAERAGLGFTGKNTMLIAPRLGSTFFLGEILTTTDLTVTDRRPMPGCGSCRRCINVCPTQALISDHVMDARLCISYLTIENRGEIARELRGLLGNHIFGCDECQDCCPWNDRFSAQTKEPLYRAGLERQAPRLLDMARLNTESFYETFAGSAVLRPGLSGFLRNVAVALGNWGDEQALEGIELLLHQRSALVRQHAAWAAGRIGTAGARQLLHKLCEREEHPAVLAEVREE